jgi:tetratricopeptide (TPR) repeat protein
MRAQLLLAVLSLTLVSSVHAVKQVASAERRFLWNQANSQMASAHGAGDFAEAAATYRRLVASGARNGPLFYNLGTALLRAGQYEEAVDALLRAERHVGGNPEITQNLLIALAREDKEAEVALPWYRFPLFWHYGLSAHLRMAVTAGAFAAGCILLALWQLGSHTARQVMFVAWFVFALFGSSVITTLHQESQADRLSVQQALPQEGGPG